MIDKHIEKSNRIDIKELEANKIDINNIVDNLTTNDATKVLSANQGKVLNDNKEPNITKNTAFNKNYGTTGTDVKMDGVQSVGSKDEIARIDHVHPSDTSRVATIDVVNRRRF